MLSGASIGRTVDLLLDSGGDAANFSSDCYTIHFLIFVFVLGLTLGCLVCPCMDLLIVVRIQSANYIASRTSTSSTLTPEQIREQYARKFR